MTQSVWLAVRCCCTPHKILGYLRLPVEKVRDRLEIAVMMKSESPSIMSTDYSVREIPNPTEYIKLKTMRGDGVSELAIYSEDRPIEFWRRVVGFVEARS